MAKQEINRLPEVEEIIKLLKRGFTQSQIAQKYGVSRQGVSIRLKRALKKK